MPAIFLAPPLSPPTAQTADSEASDATPSAGGAGDNLASSPFQGVPELTPEIWAPINGDGGHPRTSVGVFLLDRFSEGFASALEAAKKAAEQTTVRLGKLAGGTAFVWADAPCQEGFAKDLGLSDVSVSRVCFLVLCVGGEIVACVIVHARHELCALFSQERGGR